MPYQIPDSVKGIQTLNDAVSVSSLDYPFFFVCYGTSAGAKAPLLSYSSANLMNDIKSYIHALLGVPTAAALSLDGPDTELATKAAMSPTARALAENPDATVVSVEQFFDEMSNATKQAAAVITFDGKSAMVESAVNSDLQPSELAVEKIKSGTKIYTRIHTGISKPVVIAGTLSIVVEAENPAAGDYTIRWNRSEGAEHETLDITIHNVECKLHLSYLSPLLGGMPEPPAKEAGSDEPIKE